MAAVVTKLKRSFPIPAERVWEFLDANTPPGVSLRRVHLSAYLDRELVETETLTLEWEEPLPPPDRLQAIANEDEAPA